MKIFRETGFFSLEPITVGGHSLRPRDVTAALLFPKWTFEEGEADITVMQVCAWGTKGGERGKIAFDFLDRFDAASGLRSMSRSTGFTATAIASLILDGTLKHPGVHAPEALAARPGLLDRVMDYLRARGIRCEMFAEPAPAIE
jgi:saccharopine dehydrogenase-like NADP-dependent oxidoreductase